MGASENKESIVARLLAAEGVTLAAIPFFGMFVALLFEYSYLNYYDAPVSVLQLDFVKIVAATGAVSLFFVFLIFAMFAIRLVIRSSHPLRKAMGFPLTACLLIGPFIYLGPFEYKILAILGLFFGTYFLILLGPFLDGVKGATYLERLDKSSESDLKLEYRDKEYEKFTQFLAVPLFFSLFVLGVGYNHAANKEKYMTLVVGGEHKIVVEIYGDLMVVKDFDPQTKIMAKGVSLIKITESQPVNLKRMKVGPLVVAGEGEGE